MALWSAANFDDRRCYWDNGASRFDRNAFQHFTTQDGLALAHDRVFFIEPDRQERL